MFWISPRLKPGKLFLEQAEFDLAKPWRRDADHDHARTPEKLELSYYVSRGFPGVLWRLYPLKQVLMNLLANAIKFTERGEVVLRVENGNKPEQATLKFSVSDTGIGIAHDQQQAIFKCLFPSGQLNHQKVRRHWIGPDDCARIVDMNGRQNLVESEPGKGSTFSLPRS